MVYKKFLLVALILGLFLRPNSSLGQAELPVLVKQVNGGKVLFQIDDSGSMYAALEHSDFNINSSVAQNDSLDIPSVIFRLESGSASPNSGHQLRPVLVEINLGFNYSSSGDLWASKSLNSPTSMALVNSMTCNTTSSYAVCCPGTSGSSCPKIGINTATLFENSSVVGSSIFSTSKLAKVGSSYITDSSGNEFLYMSYRRNDYESQYDDWSDVWASFSSTGNLIPYHTRVFGTTGQTVVFNQREVFLSAGWYRIEYLRWIFYGATTAQLATLPGVNRMQAVKDVVSNLILANPSVEFGLATLNGTSYTSGVHSGNNYGQWLTPDGDADVGAYPKIRKAIGSSSASLISSLNSITARSGTPLANTYIEALRYFGGASARDSYYSSNYYYSSPIESQCDAHSIIVLTDGLPTAEENNKLPNNNWVTNFDGEYDGAYSNYKCQNYSSTLCAEFMDDAAWWAYHNDLKGSVAGVQNITTYTVGLGIDYDLLDKVAANGGSGQSYLVTSVAEISDTLQDIVDTVLNTPTSGAGVATLDKLYGEAFVYQPTFFADTWTGNINVYHYASESEELEFNYDMAALLEERDLSLNPRNIIAGYDADSDGNTKESIAFDVSNAATLGPQLFKFVITGAVSSSLLATPWQAYTANSSAETLINYISGQAISGARVRDRDNDGYVDRLGDVVYSRPIEVGPKNGNYNSMSGYTSFTKSLNSQPRILLVGANDGMLHAFDSISGEELWAYIPSSQVPYLERLGRLEYNQQYRRSYVDGQIAVEDVFVGGSWRTYAMFGLRTGGSQYIVLDITNRSSPSLVFEVNPEASAGQSWSKPAVVLSNGPSSSSNPANFNWYMVVGTGEGKTSSGTNLLVYSLASSSNPPTPTVKTISGSDPVGTRTSSPTTVQGDADFNVDRIYIGTEEGDMFRVTVGGSPSAWGISKLYDGSSAQPIVAAPAVVLADNPQYTGAGSGVGSEPLAIGVYWGTGRYDTQTDIATITASIQNIFGIFDPVNTAADSWANVLYNKTKSSLANQSVTSFDVRRDSATGKYYTPTGKAGFYINLDLSINVASGSYINPVGQVVHPAINSHGILVFSTFLADNGSCDIGGYSFLQGVHFQTGGGAVVDIYSDEDKPFYNGGIPDLDGDFDYDSVDLTSGYNSGVIQPVLDAHIESVDLTNDVTPYSHDGLLLQNDIRLHSSNGGILPAISSIGHTGLSSQPSLLSSAGKILIQPAYPSDPESGNDGSQGDPGDTDDGDSGGDSGSTNGMPAPTLMPINLYNVVMKVLSFHESTSN